MRPQHTFIDHWVLLIDILGFSDRMADVSRRAEMATAYHSIIDALPYLSNVVVASHVRPSSLEHETIDMRREKLAADWRNRVRV